MCDMIAGSEYYLALRGAEHCSEYDVTVSFVPPEELLVAQEHCVSQAKQYEHRSATVVRQLVRDGFVYSTVQPHEIH
eukprot:COSAG02_NODE_20900_length_811_cov_1.063202_1_plen_76_part_10